MLMYFRRGYDLRRDVEGQPYDWSDDRQGNFAAWIRQRFKARGRALNHLQVISSFAPSEADAFHTYFQLLEDYHQVNQMEVNSRAPLERRHLSFLEIVRGLRQHEYRYVRHPTLRGCCAFLMGEDHAYQDLRLPNDENRASFKHFQRWVEEHKNRALPRSWFKVIYFWSGGVDCCHTADGAISLLWKWLDEYTQEIGRPGLFQPSNSQI